eukprot:Pgem_evm2s3195
MLYKLGHGLESYDGADQGFLTEYFKDMDNARLFDPSKPDVSEESMNRLSIGFNMHHLYYYEKMNWDLYSRGHFKTLPTKVPAYSIGYPINPSLKPWYWWSYLLMDNHWYFYNVRKELGESWFLSFLLRALLIIGVAASAPILLARIKGEHIIYFLLLQFGDSVVSFFFGFSSVILSAYIGGSLVPGLMPPPLAWTLFIINNT